MNIKDLDKYQKDDVSVKNRTRAYILPCLHKYKTIFKNKINQFSFVAVGLYDCLRPDLFDDTTIGFLVDMRESDTTNLDDIPYLVDNYYFGENLYGRLHMLVVKIPAEYHLAIPEFIQGKYSKMYSNPGEVFGVKSGSSYFNHVKRKCVLVCKKADKLRLDLEKKLDTSIEKGAELDDIIDPIWEVFNYEGNEKIWKTYVKTLKISPTHLKME